MTRDEIVRLEGYLRSRFQLGGIEVRQHPSREENAEVYLLDERLGELFKDTEEGDLSYDFSMSIKTDADKLQEFMRSRFDMNAIEVRQRPNKDDSAEVYIGDEFIGVLFEDGDVYSYAFNMSILEYDLEEA